MDCLRPRKSIATTSTTIPSLHTQFSSDHHAARPVRRQEKTLVATCSSLETSFWLTGLQTSIAVHSGAQALVAATAMRDASTTIITTCTLFIADLDGVDCGSHVLQGIEQ